MQKKRILICDDEEGVRESLNLILENDYELDFANNGAEAVNKIKEAPYDGLLLDIKMPVRNGLETLEEIRKIAPELKVIIITGYQSVEMATKAMKLGAVEYISKPFNKSEVFEKTRNLLK
ncbi:MAG: response regulator [Candidatus Omnitrophica bacterium]|nr:response regulator [Candidatus Omnitrophota bacterium]